MWASITSGQQCCVNLACSDLQGLPLIHYIQCKSSRISSLPILPSLPALVSWVTAKQPLLLWPSLSVVINCPVQCPPPGLVFSTSNLDFLVVFLFTFSFSSFSSSSSSWAKCQLWYRFGINILSFYLEVLNKYFWLLIPLTILHTLYVVAIALAMSKMNSTWEELGMLQKCYRASFRGLSLPLAFCLMHLSAWEEMKHSNHWRRIKRPSTFVQAKLLVISIILCQQSDKPSHWVTLVFLLSMDL